MRVAIITISVKYMDLSYSSIFCTLCGEKLPNDHKMKIHAETCQRHIKIFEKKYNCSPPAVPPELICLNDRKGSTCQS